MGITKLELGNEKQRRCLKAPALSSATINLSVDAPSLYFGSWSFPAMALPSWSLVTKKTGGSSHQLGGATCTKRLSINLVLPMNTARAMTTSPVISSTGSSVSGCTMSM